MLVEEKSALGLEEQLLPDTQPLLEEPTSSSSGEEKFKPASAGRKAFNWASTGLEGAFAYFMFLSLIPAVERLAIYLTNPTDPSLDPLDSVDSSSETTKTILTVSSYIAIALAILNLGSDLFSANPIEEAQGAQDNDEKASNLEALIQDYNKAHSERQISEERTKRIQSSIQINNIFNTVTCYLPGALADTVVLNALAGMPALYWPGVSIVAALGIQYYRIIFTNPLAEHIFTFYQKSSEILNDIKNKPVQGFEFLVRVLLNSIYRGVTFGFIVDMLLGMYFKSEINDNIRFSALTATILANIYVTLNTRTLPVHKQIFENHKKILEKLKGREIDYSQAVVSKTSMALDLTLSALTRTLPLTLLTFQAYLSANPDADDTTAYLVYTACLLFGMTAGAFAFYADYLVRRDRAAAEALPETAGAQNQVSTKTPLEQVLEIYKQNPGVNLFAQIFSDGGRIARWVAFTTFLFGVNTTLGSPIQSFNEVMLWTLLVASITARADAPTFTGYIIDGSAMTMAKLQTLPGNATLLERFIALFWRSEKELQAKYGEEHLNAFLSRQTNSQDYQLLTDADDNDVENAVVGDGTQENFRVGRNSSYDTSNGELGENQPTQTTCFKNPWGWFSSSTRAPEEVSENEPLLSGEATSSRCAVM